MPVAALVDYGSSSDDERPPKRPLPAVDFGGGDIAAERLCYAFVRGASAVGVQLTPVPVRGQLASVLAKLQHDHSFERVEFCDDEALHVSLMRPTLIARQDERAFVRDCREACVSSAVRRFAVAFSNITSLESDSSARVFFAFVVSTGWSELRALSSVLDNNVLTSYDRLWQTQYFGGTYVWFSAAETRPR